MDILILILILILKRLSHLNPISQLRFDCDTTTTRLRRKTDMFIFLLASNRVERKQARAIHRSRIVVVSYSRIVVSVRFAGGVEGGLTPPLDEDDPPSGGQKFWSGRVGFDPSRPVPAKPLTTNTHMKCGWFSLPFTSTYATYQRIVRIETIVWAGSNSGVSGVTQVCSWVYPTMQKQKHSTTSVGLLQRHVNKVASVCFHHIQRLRQIRRLLGTDLTAALFSTFLLSRLDYCNAILAGLPRSTIAPLQRAQNQRGHVHRTLQADWLHVCLHMTT